MKLWKHLGYHFSAKAPSASSISSELKEAHWIKMQELELKMLNSTTSLTPSLKGWFSIPREKIVKSESKGNSLKHSSHTSPLYINTCKWDLKASHKDKSDKLVVLLLHGYASGLAKMIPLVQTLEKQAQSSREHSGTQISVVAFDWLGWGLSSRPDFGKLTNNSNDPNEIIRIWIQTLRELIAALNLNEPNQRVIVVGHSMGSYLGLASLLIPEMMLGLNVERYIFLSPVGMVPSSSASTSQIPFPSKSRSKTFVHKLFLSLIWANNTPQSVLQLLTKEHGQQLLKIASPRLIKNYEPFGLGQVVLDYTYAISVAPSSGDIAFRNLAKWNGERVEWSIPIGPLLWNHKAHDVTKSTIELVYGERDWTDMQYAFKHGEKQGNIQLKAIPSVGHHMFSGAPEEIAQLILDPKKHPFPMTQQSVKDWLSHRNRAGKSSSLTRELKHSFLSWFT